MILKAFTKELLKRHKVIIKPWKKTEKNHSSDWYIQGWNDCRKQMEINHNKMMKFFEENGILP